MESASETFDDIFI